MSSRYLTMDIDELREYVAAHWKLAPNPRDGYVWKEGQRPGAARVGKPVGYVDANGYRRVHINGVQLKLHRVVFALNAGRWPQDLDHIDGDRLNNDISNLRETNTVENGRNQKLHSRNTSGTVGVYWHERHQKWVASIGVRGRLKHLGTFASKNEAMRARKEAERRIGFSERHGNAIAAMEVSE